MLCHYYCSCEKFSHLPQIQIRLISRLLLNYPAAISIVFNLTPANIDQTISRFLPKYPAANSLVFNLTQTPAARRANYELQSVNVAFSLPSYTWVKYILHLQIQIRLVIQIYSRLLRLILILPAREQRSCSCLIN